MCPKLLLLDEVNAGLNTAEIDTALDLTRRIAERGITILIIEHLMKVLLDDLPARSRAPSRRADRRRNTRGNRRGPQGDRGLSRGEVRGAIQSRGGQCRINLLEIEHVQSGYGDVQVLWDVSTVVEAGEIACIVGSNGAGKTTLLRTISGLVALRAGSIRFDGREIGGLPPEQVLGLGIAHVPEGRRLFRGLSVRDNLMLGAYLRRDTHEVERDLDAVFELFPILRERQSQDATTMSGGEQQMCAIGRGSCRARAC